MPGMYAVTSSPLVKRTRATLRSAEFGFFGVTVFTCVHTPRRCGFPRTSNDRVGRSGWPGLGPVKITRKARVFTFFSVFSRPRRTNWLMVGNDSPLGAAYPENGPRRSSGTFLVPELRQYTRGPVRRQTNRRPCAT